MDLKKLYEENEDFRHFVDAYSNHYFFGRSIDVSEALTHAIVRQYAQYILDKGDEEHGRSLAGN